MASNTKHISVLFDHFLQRQHDLFASLSALSNECRAGIATTHNVDEKSLLWNILRSVAKFESQFGQLENDFWAYWENETETAYYFELAAASGYSSFVDYLLGELEKCNSWIDEITTELAASGWTWETVEALPDEFWALMDATEELIEASTAQLPHDELQKLLARIPPQRLAPIQLEVIDSRFELKRINRSPLKVSLSTMRTAFSAIKSEAKETLNELRETNCDRRFVGCFDKLVQAIDLDFNSIEAVEIGINLIVVENSVRSVRDEVAETVYGRLMGNVVNIRHFISNFRDWREYSNAGFDGDDLKNVLQEAIRLEFTLNHRAFSESVREQARYYATISQQYSKGEGHEVKSAFVLGMQNIISAVAREILKYIRLAAEKTAVVVGTSIGAVATAWVAANLEVLKVFAHSHRSFTWMIDVIVFIQKHLVI